MANFAVTVERLQAIEPHPNADRLDLAVVGEYRSIIRKGQHAEGDLVAYIPEASILPDVLIEEMGLTGRLAGKQANRVKAIRLRGIVSQGLCYPAREGWVEGQDVTEELGIIKYEPRLPAHMGGVIYNASRDRCLRYDVENWKRWPDVLQDGEEVQFTEKIHGCMDPSTLVMLPNGDAKPIGEIIEDESITHVLSYDVETREFVPKRITGRSRRPPTDYTNRETGVQHDPKSGSLNIRWVRLTLENGRKLTCTADHPLYSRDRQAWIPAGEILPDEDIESPVR